ncbi:hypothetical protein QR98_0051430 [Sarcoptes scabiei]|uniref:Uncharacterized protein n=1 Tax=Sarcoptes scabiei TaxID=52283 RepID=A0A132A7Q0_SARSC|nr:hypothetical protein QR98_0051430 [Sarcoptes scabiei]
MPTNRLIQIFFCNFFPLPEVFSLAINNPSLLCESLCVMNNSRSPCFSDRSGNSSHPGKNFGDINFEFIGNKKPNSGPLMSRFV